MDYPAAVVEPISPTSKGPTATRSTTTVENHTRLLSAIESQGTTATNKQYNFCKACVELVMIVLFLCYLTFIFYGVIAFSPPKFKVDSVTVYPLNITSSHTTAIWVITFSVTNPNYGNGIKYEDVKASVFYKGTNVSSTELKSFSLKERFKENHRRSVEANLHVNASVAEAIASDYLSKGFVIFTAFVNTTVRLNFPGTHVSKLFGLGVSCEKIKVDFLPDVVMLTMLGSPRKCNVMWRQW